MKKFFVFLCFSFALLLVCGAVLLSIQEPQTSNVQSAAPEVITDLDTAAYVSLPAIEMLQYTEEGTDTEAVSNDYEQAAIDQLFATAKKLDAVTDDCTVICDCMVSKDGNYIKEMTDYPLSIDSDLPDTVRDNLTGKTAGETITIQDVEGFEDVEEPGIDLMVTVKQVLGIPYPVTDNYMKKNTEYQSFSDMVRQLAGGDDRAERQNTRQSTISSLLDYVVSLTTFVDFPDVILKQELEVVRSQVDPNAQYEDARESLKKIMCIKAILETHDVIPEEEEQERWQEYLETDGSTLQPYEQSRERYLIFEEDVINYLYKVIEIIPG